VLKTVLMIDDDSVTGDLICSLLANEGFRVTCLGDGPAGITQFRKTPPDLVVLELSLPRLSGLDVLKEIRNDEQFGSTPVFVLTARTEEADTVIALELGADDYMAKPVRPREFVARVKALLRRGLHEPRTARPIQEGELFLDPEAMAATFRGQRVALSALEFRLLHFLAANPGKVYSRDRLLTAAWGKDRFVTERSVDTYMWRLRKKLDTVPGLESPLKTFRGGGYTFNPVELQPSLVN
jgi:DNA-binding response OmpR family regulator